MPYASIFVLATQMWSREMSIGRQTGFLLYICSKGVILLEDCWLFLMKAFNLHGLLLTCMQTKLHIICPIHLIFLQSFLLKHSPKFGLIFHLDHWVVWSRYSVLHISQLKQVSFDLFKTWWYII